MDLPIWVAARYTQVHKRQLDHLIPESFFWTRLEQRNGFVNSV
jgi:hypothetical protein